MVTTILGTKRRTRIVSTHTIDGLGENIGQHQDTRSYRSYEFQGRTSRESLTGERPPRSLIRETTQTGGDDPATRKDPVMFRGTTITHCQRDRRMEY